MILVLTTQAGDYSHLKIVDWLNFSNADFLVITGESVLLGEDKFLIRNNEVFYNDINLTKKVSCVFYRRWFTRSQFQITSDKLLDKSLANNMVSEMYEIRNFLFEKLKSVKWIPDARAVSVSKLNNLVKAQSFKLNVPEYIITNSKDELLKFYHDNLGKVITKAIGNFQKSNTENGFLVNPIYTKTIKEDLLNSLPNKFVLSFFQKLIIKKHEYRILYFNKKCFPTMILSQENDLTKIDSRLHSDDYEARLVPAKISDELENKIIQFMDSLNLNIGCLDFLYSEDNQYYFLEVNPVGQFGGYSERCILDFEEEIVKKLIKIDNE